MVEVSTALAADPKRSQCQALQKSMLAMIENTQHPEWPDPKYWVPFVVVGKAAKPRNGSVAALMGWPFFGRNQFC